MEEENKIVMNSHSAALDVSNTRSKKVLTTAIYALQATAFFLGITYIIAVVINYVKQDDVSGTWLASHFRWQIRTFWFSILWWVIGFITTFILIGYLVLLANTVWVIYRIVKGWLRLAENKPMYTID